MNETLRSPQTAKLDPKKQQFYNDLQDLLKHYQYRIVPMLDVKATGIVPIVAFPDALPAKKAPSIPPSKKVATKPRKRKKK